MTELPEIPDMPELGEDTSEVMIEEAGMELGGEESEYEEAPPENDDEFDMPEIPELPVE